MAVPNRFDIVPLLPRPPRVTDDVKPRALAEWASDHSKAVASMFQRFRNALHSTQRGYGFAFYRELATVTVAPVSFPAWVAFDGANRTQKTSLDFTGYTEARLIVNYINIAAGAVTLRLRDLTNSVNIGNGPTLSQVVWTLDEGSWQPLDPRTVGRIPFDLEMRDTGMGDSATIGSITLELR